MPRKNLMAGNWKMNATHLEAIQMVQKLSYRLDHADHERVEVVVCPPFTALRSVQLVIETDHLPIGLGAQDVFWEEEGAFTGEVSPKMLESLGVAYVIVGHSERRHVLGEDDSVVNRKLHAVLEHEMIPILAVGETLEEREEGLTEERVQTQLQAGLRRVTPEKIAGVVIAYEPVWAIGTGRNAAPDDAGAVVRYLRDQVGELAGNDVADEVRILYGGSVNPGNIAGFMAKRDIDGGLVGGASLDPDTFASVIRYWV